MRLQLLSDLHCEFHFDQGAAFIDSLDPEGVDVLVLAGDICLAHQIVDVLGMFCAKYPKVVYVTGNHEAYNSTIEIVKARVADATQQNSNLHYLDKSVVTIDGVRFIGGTMWFAKAPNVPKGGMNDFRVIRGDFTKWVYQESDATVAFFERELREGDVLITHHLPSHACVAPQFKGSLLNAFFVRDIHRLIEDKKPALALFGHTHCSVDLMIGATRAVCNPFGYLRVEENAHFIDKLVIDVEPTS